MKKTIVVEVIFYKNVRKTPPIQGYRPHFVIIGTEDYLGIIFTQLDTKELGTKIIAEATFIYDGIDYSTLTIGTRFEIREAQHIVGEGVVLD